MGDGEEWHVFDVWIMLGGIRHDMVYIMITFPPSKGEASYKIGYEHADKSVNMEAVSYAHMARIMDSEDQLMPESSKKETGQGIPSPTKRNDGEGGEDGLANAFDPI